MSLTGHLDDPASPVRRHFEVTYPHIKEVRFAATSAPASSITIDGRSHSVVSLDWFNPGQPKVLPGAEEAGDGRYDWGAAGTAFDYFSRHGYLWRLPVEELLARLHGGTLDLTSARAQFADISWQSLAPRSMSSTRSGSTIESGREDPGERSGHSGCRGFGPDSRSARNWAARRWTAICCSSRSRWAARCALRSWRANSSSAPKLALST